jgi:hypothetical protein
LPEAGGLNPSSLGAGIFHIYSKIHKFDASENLNLKDKSRSKGAVAASAAMDWAKRQR